MSLPIRMRGTPEEALLFRLLGVSGHREGEPCLLLLGVEEEVPDDVEAYVRLPDSENPSRETERLAEELGRAVGHSGLNI